jgi:hypothetical protein
MVIRSKDEYLKRCGSVIKVPLSTAFNKFDDTFSHAEIAKGAEKSIQM